MKSYIWTHAMTRPQETDIVTSHSNPVLCRYVPKHRIHEFDIARRLQMYPHPNIPKVYDITNEYIDFEIGPDLSVVVNSEDSFVRAFAKVIPDQPYDPNIKFLPWAWSETVDKYGKEKFRRELFSAKCHMQLLRIYYFEWDARDVFVGADGNLKVFNFEYAKYTYQTEPQEGSNSERYWTAAERGMRTYKSIDDHAFEGLMTDLSV